MLVKFIHVVDNSNSYFILTNAQNYIFHCRNILQCKIIHSAVDGTVFGYY